MNTESIITIITSVIGSGLLSLLLQRHWAVEDAKKAEEKAQSEEVKREQQARERDSRMLKKIFRANLTREINDVRRELDDPALPDSTLRLHIIDLRDDMADYFEMGGNGATHAAYVALYKEITQKKPELISIAWLDCMSADIDQKG